MIRTIIIKPLMLRKPSMSQGGYRQATFNSFQSLQPSEYCGDDTKLQSIPSLMTKFVHLSSQLEIQNRISSFNLIDYDKDDIKVVFDEHIAAAKLKRIENNAELKRANMELFLRKRKLQRIKQAVIKTPARKESPKNRQKGEHARPHKDLFQSFGAHNQQKKNQDNENSFDEEFEESAKEQHTDTHPQGVKYFDFLKKHPKLVSFTLEKVKEKNMLTDRQKFQKRDRILKFRNQMRTVSRSESRIANQDKLNITTSGPQQIAEQVFRKIYTKKNQSRAVSQAKNDIRLNSFIHKQEQILESLNQKAMSKQNYKKLKERLDDLLAELYKNDKKHRIQLIHQRRFSKTPEISNSQL